MKNVLRINMNQTANTTTKNTDRKGEIKMTNTTRNRKHSFITKIVAGILSAITLISVGTMAITSASAAEVNDTQASTYKGNTIYYSDNYFRHPSTEYDTHLATLSCIMTNFSIPLGNPKSLKDDKWYLSQPERLYGFFSTIGFGDFETNKDYVSRSAFDTIGVAAASKKVDDCTVIGVGIRSGGYFLEWSNNVYLGDGTKSDYMHEGWYNAANKAISFINDYISSNRITGKVKIWIAGFSRGGATTNLVAGLLDNKIDNGEKIFNNNVTLSHDDIYAYTFEAPQGANYNSKSVKKPGDPIYNNIFNVVNPNDLVPKVAMSEYGFTRFGTDKFITTKFFDPSGFENNRKTFKALYVENGSKESEYKADDFKMYGTPLKKCAPLIAETIALLPVGVADTVSKIKSGKILEADTRKINYDANIAAYLMLEEMTKNIGNRNDYCKKYQSGVSKFLLALMTDVNALKDEEIEALITKIALSKGLSLIPGFGDLTREAIRSALPKDVNAEQVIDAVDPLLKVLSKVYWERPNEVISLGLYIKEVFQTHDNGVNIAHLEAQDSNYVNAYNEKNGTNLSLVGLREFGDFGRVTFKDYNDISLFNDKGNACFVRVKGAKLVKSEIERCSDGFAVGYYSYATEEGMELFMPVNRKYILNMKGYSIKPKHDVSYYAFYQSVSSNIDHRYRSGRGSFSDWYCGNTAYLQRGINMMY